MYNMSKQSSRQVERCRKDENSLDNCCKTALMFFDMLLVWSVDRALHLLELSCCRWTVQRYWDVYNVLKNWPRARSYRHRLDTVVLRHSQRVIYKDGCSVSWIYHNEKAEENVIHGQLCVGCHYHFRSNIIIITIPHIISAKLQVHKTRLLICIRPVTVCLEV